MKLKYFKWIITIINFVFILIFLSVPLWGIWSKRFRIFVWEIPLWSLLYYFMLFVVIGFLVYLIKKATSYRKMQKLLWFFREIPEHTSDIVIVTQEVGQKLIVYLNKSAELFYNVNSEDYISKKTLPELLEGGQTLSFQKHPLESDGKHIFTINIAQPPTTVNKPNS